MVLLGVGLGLTPQLFPQYKACAAISPLWKYLPFKIYNTQNSQIVHFNKITVRLVDYLKSVDTGKWW